MKLTIPTKDLLAALATLKTISKVSTTYPVLGNVLIVATTPDILTLTGTDGEKQLVIALTAKVKEHGSTTIICGKLHDSVSKMRAPECVIESNDKQEVTVRAGTAVTKLLGLQPEEMDMHLLKINNGEGLNIPAQVFNSAVGKSISFAPTPTGKDKHDAVFQSVILLSRNKVLNAQAGNRQHIIICATEIPFEEPVAFIIPRESAATMIALAEDGELELLISENLMSVKSEGKQFTTKLIESNIPDFEKAFPVERPNKITCSRSELLSIVDYAEVQTSEIASFVHLVCDGKTITAKGAKVASASDGEFFDANEDSAKVKNGSATCDVKLNPQYLRDAIKAIEGDEVTLEFSENEKYPVVMQEKAVRSLIAPMADMPTKKD